LIKLLQLPSFTLKLTCNSLLLNLPATQTNRLQLVLNSAARAVTKTPQLHYIIHITPILKSLHWREINVKIKYKVLSLTYKSLKTGQPSYHRSLIWRFGHKLYRACCLVGQCVPMACSGRSWVPGGAILYRWSYGTRRWG